MAELVRDLKHLIEFLEFAKTNGYVNPKTADNRIKITKDIFATVPNIDTSDIPKLDVESIFGRYTVLTTNKIPASSLQSGKSHFKSAIREFATYIADPVHYKPGISKPKKEVTQKPTPEKPSKKPPLEKKLYDETNIPHKEPEYIPSLHIDIQVHISPQALDTQIDKVFESMARHLKDLYHNTK